jgi:hypothetical protein
LTERGHVGALTKEDDVMAKNWIAGAIKHPGALHRELGVPEGQKIPSAKLEAAKKNASPRVMKMINLANTLKKMKPKR